MIEVKITGIEDLLTFVTIIRGEELDMQRLQAATKSLNESTGALVKAEEDAQKEKKNA